MGNQPSPSRKNGYDTDSPRSSLERPGTEDLPSNIPQ